MDATYTDTTSSTLTLRQRFQRDRKLRSSLIIGVITFIFTTAICIPVITSFDEGVLAFAHIGTFFSEGEPNGSIGYDGQFAYFIARDGAEAVPFIDGPTLRYQRILYPVLARALALGSADLVPWTLLGINIVAHSVGAALLAYILAGFGAPPAGALIFTFWIGNLFGVRFNLNEPLCFALAIAAIVAYQKDRYRLTIILLMLSTIAKELGLVIAAGLALHAFWNRRWGWSILIFGGPLLLFLTWWGVMRLWFGTLPTIYPAAKIHFIPFEGLFSLVNDHPRLADRDPATLQLEFGLLLFFMGIPTLLFLLAAVWRFIQRRDLLLAASLVIPAAGFVMTMPDVSWHDQVAAYRVGAPIVITGILFTGYFHKRKLKWLAAYWIPAALLIFLIPGLWSGGA